MANLLRYCRMHIILDYNTLKNVHYVRNCKWNVLNVRREWYLFLISSTHSIVENAKNYSIDNVFMRSVQNVVRHKK